MNFKMRNATLVKHTKTSNLGGCMDKSIFKILEEIGPMAELGKHRIF